MTINILKKKVMKNREVKRVVEKIKKIFLDLFTLTLLSHYIIYIRIYTQYNLS